MRTNWKNFNFLDNYAPSKEDVEWFTKTIESRSREYSEAVKLMRLTHEQLHRKFEV